MPQVKDKALGVEAEVEKETSSRTSCGQSPIYKMKKTLVRC